MVLWGAGSGLLGGKVKDMCKGLLANFLLSPLEIICLLDKDGELILFIVEEAGDTVLVGVVNAGFELGAEIGDALAGHIFDQNPSWWTHQPTNNPIGNLVNRIRDLKPKNKMCNAFDQMMSD